MKLTSAIIVLLTGALCVGFSDAELDRKVKKQYDSLVKEVKSAINNRKYSVLDGTARQIHPIAPRYNGVNLNEPQSLAKVLLLIYREKKPKKNQEKKRFLEIYEKYVAKPCADISSLKQKVDNVMSRNPELNNSRYYGSLPYPFLFMDELCVGLRYQGQDRTYEELMSLERHL